MNNKNEHILSASSNLLGFSFVAVTMMREFGLIHTNRVDQFAALNVGLFTASVMLSFLSIRTHSDKLAKRYETVAEYVFMLGLLSIAVLILLVEVRLV